MGDKPGDNGQLEVVGEALGRRPGWQIERRRVEVRPEWIAGKPRVEASVHHIDRQRSDPLEPPWPDVVVTIGRRPSMVALWIKEQAGKATRIVRIGKPTGPSGSFDLVIASAEVQVAPGPHILRIGLPLMRVDAEAVRKAAEAWRPVLAKRPRPLVGFLLGGPTLPYRFGPMVLASITEEVERVLQAGGTPWVTTSRRTPPAVIEALARRLPSQVPLYRWRADDPANPYRALLGLADGLIVTGDSISMMVEVARLGRPLQVLPLSSGPIGRLDIARRRATRALFDRAERKPWRQAASLALRAGLSAQTRDYEAFHAMLLERGLATPLGTSFRPPTGPVADDAEAVVEAIVGLISPPELKPA